MTHKNLVIIVSVILMNLLLYSLTSFIYFDFNPTNWWLIKSMWGRLILIIVELYIIGSTINTVEKNNQ
jgi:hypothetical protein